MAKSVGVILAAAGQARRMGMGRNKAYLNLQGRPILAYSLQFFAAWPQVRQLVVVTGSEDLEWCQQLVSMYPEAADKTLVVAGGKERQDSVAQGLAAIAEDIELIAVHDAARPFIDQPLWERVLAGQAAGVIPGLPVTDTIKKVDDGMIMNTVSREGLYSVQTPQLFTAAVLRECYARAQAEGFYGTDDASLLERYQFPVQIVAGAKHNLKITTPEDLDWAEYWLDKVRLASGEV